MYRVNACKKTVNAHFQKIMLRFTAFINSQLTQFTTWIKSSIQKTHTPIYALKIGFYLNQICTNFLRQVALVTKFCNVAPGIFICSVWNLLYVIILAPRIFRRLLGFKKIVYPWSKLHRSLWFIPYRKHSPPLLPRLTYECSLGNLLVFVVRIKVQIFLNTSAS